MCGIIHFQTFGDRRIGNASTRLENPASEEYEIASQIVGLMELSKSPFLVQPKRISIWPVDAYYQRLTAAKPGFRRRGLRQRARDSSAAVFFDYGERVEIAFQAAVGDGRVYPRITGPELPNVPPRIFGDVDRLRASLDLVEIAPQEAQLGETLAGPPKRAQALRVPRVSESDSEVQRIRNALRRPGVFQKRHWVIVPCLRMFNPERLVYVSVVSSRQVPLAQSE